MGWTEYKAYIDAQGDADSSREEGAQALSAARHDLWQSEANKKALQLGLGTEAQLEHGGIRDWQADENGGYRFGYTIKDIRKAGLFGTVKNAGLNAKDLRQANKYWEGSYKAAVEGDFETADRLRAVAMSWAEEHGLTDLLDESKFDAKKMKRHQQLMSQTGLLAGEIVSYAGDLRDPESPESQALIESLTDGPIAQIDAAENDAHQAISMQSRIAERKRRDLTATMGGARSFGAETAIQGALDVRFAQGHSAAASTAGAARASIYGDAQKFYLNFREQYGISALDVARKWTNSRAFVNDTYRALQASLAGATADFNLAAAGQQQQVALTAFTTNANLQSYQDQIKAQKQGQWMSLIAGVVGASIGAIGAVVAASYGAQADAATSGANG